MTQLRLTGRHFHLHSSLYCFYCIPPSRVLLLMGPHQEWLCPCVQKAVSISSSTPCGPQRRTIAGQQGLAPARPGKYPLIAHTILNPASYLLS
jgi:hypothetical protein